MVGLNRAYFIGTCGNDPEARHTTKGITITAFSIAVPESVKEGDTYTTKPTWLRLTAFGKNGDYVAKYCKKGMKIAVECSVHPSKWVNKEGITQYSTTLRVDRVLWVNSKDAGNPVPAAAQGRIEDMPSLDEPTGQEIGEQPPPLTDDDNREPSSG